MLYQKALELAKGGLKPLDIAAFLGIEVLFLPFKAIEGIALSLGSHKFIQINNALTEIEQQFVCGYELAHLLLQQSESNVDSMQAQNCSYIKQQFQDNPVAGQMLLGEEAKIYHVQIKEAAASDSLKEMAEFVSTIAPEESKVYGKDG
jgi:Zn-dependent peptidase ImmA (M78 family)